jgi:hypothetical protein
MEQDPDVVRLWIQTVLESGVGLTKWEADFVASIDQQFQQKKSLSEKQLEVLERIYAAKTP